MEMVCTRVNYYKEITMKLLKVVVILQIFLDLDLPRGRGKLDTGKYNEFQTISFPVGACTFSSTEVIKKIGFIDESHLFFLMLDDLDYGWRGWSMGIPSFYEPRAVIYHLGSPVLQWSPQKFFFLERNRWICLLTLYSTKHLLRFFHIYY